MSRARTYGIGILVFGLLVLFFKRANPYHTFEGAERYWTAGISILIGSLLLAKSWRDKHLGKEDVKSEELSNPSKTVVVCPHCGTPYSLADVPGRKCPKCDVQLEDLDGFYKRHPELK